MKHRLTLCLSVGVFMLVISGCDTADIEVYMTNNSNRDIYASFPMDELGSHVRVPAHHRVQVLKNAFGGAHDAVIQDAETRKTIAKPYYGYERPNGTRLEITYPP